MIAQKAFIENVFDRSGVDSSSDIPATPGVEAGPREEDEARGDCPYRRSCEQLDAAVDHDETGHFERCACCGVPLSHTPSDRHRKAARKIMAYLHGTGG